MLRFFRLGCACLASLGLLMVVVLSSPLVSFMTRNMAVDWFDGDADVLVVLGGSMLVDGTGPQATLGFDSYLRCTYASWSIQRHKYKYIVLSGPDGLAEAMARYLAFAGARHEEILIENAARTTSQNAEFVRKILDHQSGLPSHPVIAILTSDYHTWRARLVFEHAGMHVRAIPVPDAGKREQNVRGRWSAFIDLSEELVKDGFYKAKGQI